MENIITNTIISTLSFFGLIFLLIDYLFFDTSINNYRCKIKIVEENLNNGNVNYVIYKKGLWFSKPSIIEFTDYNKAFDYVTNHEAKRLELKEEKRQQKVIKRKTRLNIK